MHILGNGVVPVTGALKATMKQQRMSRVLGSTCNTTTGRGSYAYTLFDMVQGRKDGVNMNIETHQIIEH